MGWGERRAAEGVNSTMIYLIYCKNFCKCHNVPPAPQLKKKKERMEWSKQTGNTLEEVGRQARARTGKGSRRTLPFIQSGL
jgi:hypothetical protein